MCKYVGILARQAAVRVAWMKFRRTGKENRQKTAIQNCFMYVSYNKMGDGESNAWTESERRSISKSSVRCFNEYFSRRLNSFFVLFPFFVFTAKLQAIKCCSSSC